MRQREGGKLVGGGDGGASSSQVRDMRKAQRASRNKEILHLPGVRVCGESLGSLRDLK